MSSGLPFSVLIQMLVTTLPTLLANSIGVVIASTMLTRYPRPARLVLAGCGLNLGALGASFFMRTFVASWITGSGASAQTFFMITNFLTSMLYAIGIGLIIAAVFTDRTRPQPPDEDV